MQKIQKIQTFQSIWSRCNSSQIQACNVECIVMHSNIMKTMKNVWYDIFNACDLGEGQCIGLHQDHMHWKCYIFIVFIILLCIAIHSTLHAWICVPRRILLPPSEPLSPVRSQGPKVVQTGHKLLEMGPSQKVVQYSKTECASWAKKVVHTVPKVVEISLHKIGHGFNHTWNLSRPSRPAVV